MTNAAAIVNQPEGKSMANAMAGADSDAATLTETSLLVARIQAIGEELRREARIRELREDPSGGNPRLGCPDSYESGLSFWDEMREVDEFTGKDDTFLMST